MSKKGRLVGMQVMLDHVARESGQHGYAMVATLAAAAAEAVRDELAALEQGRGKTRGDPDSVEPRFNRAEAGSFALAAAPAERPR